MEFADLVRNAREKRFKSARQFHSSAQLPCTYYYYGSIERGAANPSIDIVRAIVDALGLDKRRALLAWARSQMTDEEAKSIFRDIDEEGHHSKDLPASQTLVINRTQSDFLSSSPLLMEILIFINCFDLHLPISIETISKRFSISITETTRALESLYGQSLIDRSDEGLYFAKEWVLVPLNRECSALNDAIFAQAYERFLRSKDPTKIRKVATVLLTPEQKMELDAQIRSLVNWAASIESKNSPDTKSPYTFGIFSSHRTFGSDNR